METWVHRGRASPEKLGNSISDFMSCYSLNITGVETDVCLTADNRPIIYHPGSTQPDLTNMTWDEIRNSIFDVLPLSSFLRSLKSYTKMSACLDIKQNSELLVEKIVRTVVEYRLQDRIFLTAFQKRSRMLDLGAGGELLLYAKRLNQTIKTHLIATFPFDLPEIAKKYQADAISFGWLDDSLISKLFFNLTVKPFVDLHKQIAQTKESGVIVWGGIVNKPEAMLYFAHLGVNGIMTDNPQVLLELIKKKKIS